MNRKMVLMLTTALFSGMSSLSFAHDPSEHDKEKEAVDCSSMKDMDHSKMDMADPVMQAMMKQCHDEMEKAKANTTPDEKTTETEKKKAKKKKHDHNEEK